MFGKLGFNVKANFILNTKFRYNPAKLAPAQREIYHQIVDECYGHNRKPVDAAILFMLVQANMFAGEARNGAFVRQIWLGIDQLRCEMSRQGSILLDNFTAEYILESAAQEHETEEETMRRRVADAAILPAS